MTHHTNKIKGKIIVLLIDLSLTTIFAVATDAVAQTPKNGSGYPLKSEYADPLLAAKKFWEAFHEFDIERKRKSNEVYQGTRHNLEAQEQTEDQLTTRNRTKQLTQAIAQYTAAINAKPSDKNRPFVLFNLAQAYVELSFLEFKGHHSAPSIENRSRSLEIIDEIIKNHNNFLHINEVLYLKAMVLDTLDKKQDARKIWEELAKGNDDQYSLYANLVIGDRDFDTAEPAKALFFYERAEGIFEKLSYTASDIDALRIYYRIAWARFKSGKFFEALLAIRKAVRPDISSKAATQKPKLLLDLGDLLAYTLLALDNTHQTKNTLKDNSLKSVAAQASLTLMNQYLVGGYPKKASDVGTIAIVNFPLSEQFPDILRTKSRSDELSGRKTKKIESLEKLALLLPRDSIWRLRYQSRSSLISHMQDLARAAAEVVATYYYQEGLRSENPRHFSMAANYFRMLLADSPNGPTAADLRLNIANAEYFSGNLNLAARGYHELITELKTPENILMTAYYQRALTMEKIWRAAFESALQRRLDTQKDQEVISSLGKLEVAAEEYADKFPSQSRAIDLILIAANANRDLNRLDQASRFWQRALLSNPSPGQRAIAIRGLIFNKIRNEKPSDTIELVTNFLRLEKSHSLTNALRRELLGVLSTAANDQATQLAKQGHSVDAGTLLLEVASEFPDILGRSKMWRDGAYFIAISGDWSRAQASAENFLKERFKLYNDDMKYLLARAHEYQLRFKEAAEAYLHLAKTYPRHERAVVALERTEKLALAGDDFMVAGKAAERMAKYKKSTKEKNHTLNAAVEHYSKSGSFANARRVASLLRDNAVTTAEKIEGELRLARVRYQSGETQIAIDDLDTLARQIERAKVQLGRSYVPLASKTNMFLGEHDLKQFESLKIRSSKMDFADGIKAKSQLFQGLMDRFDKVAKLGDTSLSPKARYLIGQAALKFADEISLLPARVGESSTLRNQARFNQNISQLRDLAQRYHGYNILAKQRSPSLLDHNIWITRSAVALSTLAAASRSQVTRQTLDQLSTASSNDMPQYWSH